MAKGDERYCTEYLSIRADFTSNSKTHEFLAAKYHLNVDSVRSRIRRYAREHGIDLNAWGEVVEKKTETVIPLFVVLPKQQRNSTDLERWQDTLSTLRQREQYVRVAHLSDVHFPDHDEAALNLAYRVIARRQPHIIVVGSDTADFSLISSFSPNADYDEAVTDELDELRRYWIPHIDTLKAAAPNAALVYILGNHEQRIYDFVEGNAPKLRRTVERAWIDMVSYQGRVMWLGRTEEVEIGHLLVKHGDATNEHAAKSLLEAESYQVSVMSGHIHRLTTYHRMGRKYAVNAITGGCLCQLSAHYLKRRPKRIWQHGTALGMVDLKGTSVWFDNIEFQHVGQNLIAVSEGDVITQPVTASAVVSAAA
jgi:hypothetical protein